MNRRPAGGPNQCGSHQAPDDKWHSEPVSPQILLSWPLEIANKRPTCPPRLTTREKDGGRRERASSGSGNLCCPSLPQMARRPEQRKLWTANIPGWNVLFATCPSAGIPIWTSFPALCPHWDAQSISPPSLVFQHNPGSLFLGFLFGIVSTPCCPLFPGLWSSAMPVLLCLS